MSSIDNRPWGIVGASFAAEPDRSNSGTDYIFLGMKQITWSVSDFPDFCLRFPQSQDFMP